MPDVENVCACTAIVPPAAQLCVTMHDWARPMTGRTGATAYGWARVAGPPDRRPDRRGAGVESRRPARGAATGAGAAVAGSAELASPRAGFGSRETNVTRRAVAEVPFFLNGTCA